MIQQTSYLVQSNLDSNNNDDHGGPTGRKLMHSKNLQSITDTFHQQTKNGFAYAVTALEQYTAVGSSDGGVRLFDEIARVIKFLQDKSVKGIPVISLDMIRMRDTSIYIAVGH